jgi:glyoxylase-like metal-dependent hydrolase (beta-lactamase superfamily II)
MIFSQVPSGGDRNYGYIVGCDVTKRAAVVDPSPDPQNCFKEVLESGLAVDYVINTHGHFDHTSGNDFFKNKFSARLVTHKSCHHDDLGVEDGQTISLGELTLSIIHTPGHSNDSICILVNNDLITGDTLFVGKVGGTSTRDSALQEFESLKKLVVLDPSIRIWPGHNYGVRPTSTIGEELKSNPFILRLNSFEDFFWLKTNWLAYKKEHGIA